MFNENAVSTDIVSAALETALGAGGQARAGGVYRLECFDNHHPNFVGHVGCTGLSAAIRTAT